MEAEAMRIVVIQQGRLRDRQVETLRDEYVKRFGRFGSLTILEKEPKGDEPLWPRSARWRVLLDERGETPTSVQFAEKLRKWTMAHGEVAFLIGDAFTTHAPSAALADARLALGPMTLPHQLAHLLLVEQLYRAATIHAGTGYHHA
jgi:23S rRNA (pseudouridine1915-N3)-methyltransferase